MDMYMKMFQLHFTCEALEEENQKLQLKIKELDKKISDYQDMNRKLHSKLCEERVLKEKILQEQNADTTEETQFGLICKYALSSNIKENASPSSAHSNSCMDTDKLGHESKKSNQNNSLGHEAKEPCADLCITNPTLEKVNKGCQCGPNGTSWISTEDLKLVLESLNQHQSDLLNSCLHPIEDIPAAAITQIPALTSSSTPAVTAPSPFSKKSKKAKNNINVNDVD